MDFRKAWYEGEIEAGTLLDEIERLRTELAASQAREKVLRDGWRAMDEAARDIRRQHLENKEGDVYHAMQWLSVTHGPMLKDIPADDTALRAALAQRERETIERCAAVCDEVAALYAVYRDHWPLHDVCKRNAEDIRALEVKP